MKIGELKELKLFDRLTFRDLLAVVTVVIILYSLVNIDLDKGISHTMAFALALVLQFYFRKTNKKPEKPSEKNKQTEEKKSYRIAETVSADNPKRPKPIEE